MKYLPRVDELIERLGTARFISTLDLTGRLVIKFVGGSQSGTGVLGVFEQKMLNLVDVISCILVHFGDGHDLKVKVGFIVNNKICDRQIKLSKLCLSLTRGAISRK